MKNKKIAAFLLAVTVMAGTLSGCGNTTINQNAVAATLDDTEISMGVANFMAQCQAVQYDAYLLSYYGEDMWTSSSGSDDGTTLTDTVKDGVMENLEEYYLLDAHAEDYKVTLTDDEKKEITDAAAKFLSDNSADAVKAMGATQENVEETLRLYKIQAKMREAIDGEVDTEVSDEESAQKTFSYILFEKSSSEDTTTDDEDTADTTDGKADNEVDAISFYNALEGSDMETIAENNGETVQTCSYGASDLSEEDNSTSLPLAILKAADKLKDGELCAEPIESDGDYYIIRMDNTDDKDAAESKKESIITERKNDHYDEVLESYKEDSKWEVNESEWAKVNFEELYTIASSQDTEDTDTQADADEDTQSEADGQSDADAQGEADGQSDADAQSEADEQSAAEE